MDDEPVALLAAELGLEGLEGILGRCCGSGVVALLRVDSLRVVCLGDGFRILGLGGRGFGRSSVSLDGVLGLRGDVLVDGLAEFELLLRHVVSCFVVSALQAWVRSGWPSHPEGHPT
ncbi:hypothetical protein QFZ52_002344 [Arthrobacter woluwensis]|nr:hypothetical protein [Arthrobacter woluwensis]